LRLAESKRRCALVLALCLVSSAHAQRPDGHKNFDSGAAVERLASALIEARTDDERRVLLAAAGPGLLTPRLRDALIVQARNQFTLRDNVRAIEIFQFVRTMAERIGDDCGVSEALVDTGSVYSIRGDSKRAVEFYQQALKRSEAVGNRCGIGYGLYATSGLQSGIGAQLAQLQRAVALLREAGEKRGVADALNLMGAILYLRGDYDAAEGILQQCLASAEEGGIKDTISFAMFHLGAVHRMKGDYAQALEFYQRSLRIQEESGPSSGLSSVLRHIGTTYYMQGDYRLALNYFGRSMRLDEMLHDEAGIAWSLFYTGGAYRAEGLYTAALDQLEKSLRLFEKHQIDDGTARVLGALGSLHHALADDELALDYLQRSLKMRERLEAKDGVAATLLNLAIVYDSQNNHQTALEAATRATDLARTTGNRDTLWRAVTIAGQSYRALNQPAQARRSFDEAIAIIEAMRAQVGGSEEEKELFFADKVSPYQQVVLMLLAQNRAEEAFAYAERARARALLDVLHQGRSDVTRYMTADERAREKVLKGEMVTLGTQVLRADGSGPDERKGLAELRARLEQTRLEYAAFQASLYSAHPALKTRRGELRPLTEQEASDLLPDERTAFIEYVVTEARTFLFVLTKPDARTSPPSCLQAVAADAAIDAAHNSLCLKVYPIEIKRRELTARTEGFRQQLAQSNLLFSAEARALYDILLKPAGEQLQGKTALVIVPDEILWELPFQALQTQDQHYLLEDYAVSYTPSLTVLRELERRKQERAPDPPETVPTLLAFGNPATGRANVKQAKAFRASRGFAAIPEAERLVKALAELYGPLNSRIYTGAQAREERLKAEAGKYRILHLAAHSVLNDASPMYSYVRLAQGPDVHDEDGLLETWEMMNMDLHAEMVVLSACETARGRISPGEGIIGLSWALFVAGAPTTVVSQWKVESASTTELMLDFHRHLKSAAPRPSPGASTDATPHITKAEALRRAELKLLHSEQYAHPFYWAAFRLVGDGF
jgi:CHAT domain-containing protein